jgi:MFS superfamily sulfate permease-like transporter
MIGIAAFVFLIGLKQVAARVKVVKWVPGPLAVVILGTLLSWALNLNERIDLKIVGHVPRGLPPPMVPVKSWDQIVEAAPFVVFIAMLTFVEHISVSMVRSIPHYIIDFLPLHVILTLGFCAVARF